MTQPPELLQTSASRSIQPISWASIASLPPKKVVSAPTSEWSSNSLPVNKGRGFQGNEKFVKTSGANETVAEEMEGKRKKRKKKPKPKPKSAPPEKPEIENAEVQEPPKIEDDEEFPDLAVSAGERAIRFRAARTYSNRQMIELQSEAWVQKDLVSASEKHFGNGLTSPRPMETSRKTARPQSASATVEREKTQGNHLGTLPLVASRPTLSDNDQLGWRNKEASKPKSGGKKSKVPIQLDLGGMLAALEQRQHSEKSRPTCKPVVLSVGGAIPVLAKEPVPVVKHQLKQGKSPHNPLDSSAPLVKKGKQREVPKAKKPSSLKKIILKEREQRKQSRLLEGQVVRSPDKDSLPQEHNDIGEDETASENNQDLLLAEVTEEEVTAHSVAIVQSSSEVMLDTPALNTPATSPNPSLPKVHSRRFREYCNQVLSKEVDSCVTDLLKELVRFQDRLFQKDPVKAKVKRRLVMGLREVLKHLKLNKLKCVIISPNCEKIQSKGGLDETLQTIIACACEQNIPFVFALNRKSLGRCVNKAVPVSVVGIFSYDGAQDHFHKMFELTMQARQDYKDMISALEKEQFEDEVAEKQTELKSELSEMRTASLPGLDEDDNEPSYIKIWKRMLEKEYDPYSLHLDETAASGMLNLHL